MVSAETIILYLATNKYIDMDTLILEKLAVDEENIEWGRRIINKDDIDAINVITANKSHNMRCDKLAMTMGVTDINQISIANEIMNPFIIEEGQTYIVPDGTASKYYTSTEPSYPITKSRAKAANNDSSTLTTTQITEILEPETDKDRQNRLKEI